MKYYFIIFFFALYSFNAKAQQIKTVQDFGIWFELGINYKINKQWGLSFNQDLRLFDNSSKIDKTISNIGASYKINSHFALGANVRYAYDRKKTQLFTHDIRYNLDFEYQHDIGEKFQLEYRLRYQSNYINLFTYYNEKTNKSDLRFRIRGKYKINENTIFASAEIFREYIVYRKPYFNNLRLTLGDQFKTKVGVLDCSINYERELNSDFPLNLFFLKIGYTFKLKHA